MFCCWSWQTKFGRSWWVIMSAAFSSGMCFVYWSQWIEFSCCLWVIMSAAFSSGICFVYWSQRIEFSRCRWVIQSVAFSNRLNFRSIQWWINFRLINLPHLAAKKIRRIHVTNYTNMKRAIWAKLNFSLEGKNEKLFF